MKSYKIKKPTGPRFPVFIKGENMSKLSPPKIPCRFFKKVGKINSQQEQKTFYVTQEF